MSKIPVVFLHGFLGCKEDWDAIIFHLPSQHELHAINWAELHSLEAIVQALDALCLSQVHLVGYSMGGRVAISLKERYPDRFLHLIILSAHVGPHSDAEQEQNQKMTRYWIDVLKTESLDAFLDKWYAQPLFDSLRNNPPLFKEVLKRRKKQHPHHLIAMLTHFNPTKTSEQLPPDGLFLYGENDAKYSALYRSLPASLTTRMIESTGHAVHLENPEACAKTFRDWISK